VSDPRSALATQQLSTALEAMNLLSRFDPRLAGALAAGTADPRLPIVLHVRAEHADEVRMLFDERGIPVRSLQTRMRVPRGASQILDGVSFLAGEQEIVIWIFSEAQFRQRLPVGDAREASSRLTISAVARRLSLLPVPANRSCS
jgi:hypothetical protein